VLQKQVEAHLLKQAVEAYPLKQVVEAHLPMQEVLERAHTVDIVQV